ncbi:MAG: hypothetical protein ACJAW7_001621 [Candidatus Azotimanducaceae bacterium]|jgi:hypothetical protein
MQIILEKVAVPILIKFGREKTQSFRHIQDN